MSGFSIQIPIPSPSPTNKHTHACACVDLHTQHINDNHLQPANKKVSACVFVRAACACTGFPSFKLDFFNGDQGCCVQGTFWAQVSVVQRYKRWDSGAGKTALR